MEAIACRSPAWGSNYIERRLVVGNVVDQFTAFGPPIDVPVIRTGIKYRYMPVPAFYQNIPRVAAGGLYMLVL